MVTDEQVRLLFKVVNRQGNPVMKGAAKAGMAENTARKYLGQGKLPSELKQRHTWRTRKDPFAEAWAEAKAFLEVNPELEIKALFVELQRRYPGQLRTLQRRVKQWKATEGPSKDVYFDQKYAPGERAQSDFTCMNELGVTIQGEPFRHLLQCCRIPTGRRARSAARRALRPCLRAFSRRCTTAGACRSCTRPTP